MDDVTMPAEVAALMNHHLAVGVGELVAGRCEAGLAEVILAWAVLQVHGASRSAMIEELPGALAPSPGTSEAPTPTVLALARELQAHFISEGQFELAQVYERAVSRVEAGLGGGESGTP